ncbi:MAG: amidohydrolase family protein [Arenibacterium sp.]
MTGLILKGGRIFDPANRRDEIGDIGFNADRIEMPRQAETVDVSGCLVTPGLIDLHTHVYWGGTSLGVDPDLYARKTAATTLVDAGSAGPGNYAGFMTHVVRPANVRVLAYIHVSFAGIYAFDDRVMVGESHDLRLMAAREAVQAAQDFPDETIGIKVRLGALASGPSGIQPLDIALDVADRTGLPLMVHIDEPPPSYGEVVDRLRPGDILTHCFRPFPNAPCLGDGTVREEIRAARERGVYFDIGHGMASFSWDTVDTMAKQGFWPDVISSDVHKLCADGPAHDNLITMTKLLAAGMSLEDIIVATSAAPAQALRRASDLGSLEEGRIGEASVIRLSEEPVTLVDAEGVSRSHTHVFKAVGTVRQGKWYPAGSD